MENKHEWKGFDYYEKKALKKGTISLIIQTAIGIVVIIILLKLMNG